MIDVVIPAWDEEEAVPRCLAAVLRDGSGLRLKIIVVANGCQDRTAERARELAGAAASAGHELLVLESPVAGKAAALNRATPHTRGGAVIYLDADVVMAPGALRGVCEVLSSSEGPLLVAPRLVARRPSQGLVRSFSIVHEALPGMSSGVVGGGCYGVSRAGRERWRAFPDLAGDDAFVRSLFEVEEQVVTEDALLTRLPEEPVELVQLVRRWHQGNLQLKAARRCGGAAAPRWLRRARCLTTARTLLTTPSTWPHVPAFALISLRARWTFRRPQRWARSDSARRGGRDVDAAVLVRPRVHVVVITYRSRALINDCLHSLRSSAAAITVTVVDNASDDGTPEVLAADRPDVHLVRSGENTGYGAAVNLVARRVASDYLLLLNPDVRLGPHTVDHLLALALADPTAGLYGGRAIGGDGVVDPTSCLAEPSLRHYLAFGSGVSATGLPFLDPDSLGGWRRDDCRTVPVLTGAVLLVDTDLWTRLGGFDERFFLYGEDVDLCLRARRLGARPAFTHLARYRHLGGASSTPAARAAAILRGKVTLADVHLGHRSAAGARVAVLVGVALRAAVTRLRRPDGVWPRTWNARAEWRRGW